MPAVIIPSYAGPVGFVRLPFLYDILILGDESICQTTDPHLAFVRNIAELTNPILQPYIQR